MLIRAARARVEQEGQAATQSGQQPLGATCSASVQVQKGANGSAMSEVHV